MYLKTWFSEYTADAIDTHQHLFLLLCLFFITSTISLRQCTKGVKPVYIISSISEQQSSEPQE